VLYISDTTSLLFRVLILLYYDSNSFCIAMSYLLQFLATAAALYLSTQYIPLDILHASGGSSSLLVFVIVLTILNTILGTVLRLITFPINLLTLGLSSFLISVLMVYLTSRVVTGIEITMIGLPIVALITSFIAMIFRIFR
jgi:putative membrane protein